MIRNNLYCRDCGEPFAPYEVQAGKILCSECTELNEIKFEKLRSTLIDVDVALSLGEQPDKEKVKKTLEECNV